MTMHTYWQRFPRDFANEYHIGIATTGADAAQYKAEGYSRINRDCALRELSYRGDGVPWPVYVTVTMDGVELDHPDDDRCLLARRLRGKLWNC